MPLLLRPTAPTAADAILVGDPGRALLLAQELLVQPKMSNHARGLWGYHGTTAAGRELTVQSTGVGGPSAALVLADLAELGMSRAVRVGTCVAAEAAPAPGELVVVEGAIAVGGSATAHGVTPGQTVQPDAGLTNHLQSELGDAGTPGTVASVDAHPGEGIPPAGALVLDMQTASLLARAGSLQIAIAVVLIVAAQRGRQAALEKAELEGLEQRAGRAAAAVLSA
ncbi:MAG TPA: hypothetical protein VG898_08285 [Solirubrobacterales bacterium]|nr:hypothetical protein [Solirubrobacterales bacterium]